MNIKQVIDNYKKPTPMKWRKIGDYVLLLQVFVTGQLPLWPVPDQTKVIVGSIVTFVGISVKFWTNTKKDDDNGEQTAESAQQTN